MKKTAKFLIFLSAIGLCAVGCKRSPEKFADKMVRKMSYKLELNDEQQQKLNSIKVALLDEYKARKEMKEKRHALFKQFVLSEKLDKEKLNKVMNEKRLYFEEKLEKYFPLIQDFHASLSANQKQKLIELSEKMRHRHHKKWH